MFDNFDRNRMLKFSHVFFQTSANFLIKINIFFLKRKPKHLLDDRLQFGIIVYTRLCISSLFSA